MKYTKEFLIFELQRFYDENGRVPVMINMVPKNGYPSSDIYKYYFKTWNNALEAANLPLNKTQENRTGLETCCKCGNYLQEGENWRTKGLHKGEVICKSCYSKSQSDYMNGNLDINTTSGLGRAGEILVLKTLGIGTEHDCNMISWGHKVDLYHDEFRKIDVKTSLFSYDYNSWIFRFNAKKDVNTYICVGLSSDRKIVEHVWVVPNVGEIRNKTGLTVKNTYRSLSNRKHLEVNSKQYDDIWQKMLLNYKDDKCNVFRKKSKDSYVEPVKQGNVVSNTVKQVEQLIDKAQQKLVDF